MQQHRHCKAFSLRSVRSTVRIARRVRSAYHGYCSCGADTPVRRPFDNRDHVLKKDTNDLQRDRIVQRLVESTKDLDEKRLEIIENMVKSADNPTPATRELIEKILARVQQPDLSASSLASHFKNKLDITEYGRAVHAEMDALLTSARSGVSPRGSLLYVTTFPCHNCTRHIVASGIERVYYIEPYGKSRAEELHEDEIIVEEKLERKRGRHRRIPFTHFVGVGPRRYFDLFSLTLGSGHELIRKQNGQTIQIPRGNAWTRVPLSPFSYLQKEERAVEEFGRIYDMQLDMFNDK